MNFFDTIAAIATPVGVGGIAIIRISGNDAESAAEKIAVLKNGIQLSNTESHKLHLAEIHRLSDESILDEVLISVMRAPHSYTGETVVEINCHGGYLSAGMILEELFRLGIRQADAGEFTRRAFMNGKTDLTRAEATIDLIHSTSSLGQSNAAKALSGKLEEKVNKIREKAIALTANLSAIADYPEEIDDMTPEELKLQLDDISSDISEMVQGFQKGKIMRDGVLTVIAGRPNVGKSSLLNALSRTERAIVTDIPGTTRDTIEEYVNINGIALRLVDTAGIRESSDCVEQIGIERARENIELADLCLFVIDASSELTDEDIEICNRVKDRNTIVILNKADKGTVGDIDFFAEKSGIDKKNFICTSTPKGQLPTGITELENEITSRFMSGNISKDDVFISNDRQKNALIKAQNIISGIQLTLDNGLPADLIYVDLEDVISALGEVTGLTVQDEIIDRVFEKFCVGK